MSIPVRFRTSRFSPEAETPRESGDLWAKNLPGFTMLWDVLVIFPSLFQWSLAGITSLTRESPKRKAVQPLLFGEASNSCSGTVAGSGRVPAVVASLFEVPSPDLGPKHRDEHVLI